MLWISLVLRSLSYFNEFCKRVFSRCLFSKEYNTFILQYCLCMRYVKDLIPEESKVLPEYFNRLNVVGKKQNPLKTVIAYFLSIIFFLAALSFLPHVLLTLLLGFAGLLLLPPGGRYVARKLRFQLTSKVKTLFVIILFVGSLPLAKAYIAADQEAIRLAEIEEREKAALEAERVRQEQSRKNKFQTFIEATISLQEEKNFEQASSALDSAAVIASNASDTLDILKIKKSIKLDEANELFKKKKYQAALPLYTQLTDEFPDNKELLYNRAVCHQKLGEIQAAVHDLQSAISLGNTEAEVLYEKINPVRRKVIGHVTRCCDGTTSSATGQGACSWHGGVCNWNEPIYEQYRKY